MYLALDCETGGLSEDTSLLSVAFILADGEFNIVDRLTLAVKPKDGVYHVNAQSLSVNNINLVKHDKIALTYEQAGTKLYEFLKTHSVGQFDKFIPVGKNTYFDLVRVWKHLVTRPTWEIFCSYQPVDINSVLRFLQQKGKIPIMGRTSLGSICNFFQIELPDHTAEKDALVSLEVYKRMCQL